MLIASIGLLVLCAQAGAETTGYLYSAMDGGIAEYDIAPGSGITAEGFAPGGAATPTDPGSIVMAKTADGENLYQLAATSSASQTIHQYTANPSGFLSAKSPAAVGAIPLLGSDEKHFMAVFNPAAKGESGQNALYVLSGPDTEHADLYIFDIDATTGALTAAGSVAAPGISFGAALAYSGNRLVISGRGDEGSGFQLAEIEASNGMPHFPVSQPDAPCPPSSCTVGALYMLDSDQMLAFNLVPNIDSKVPGTLTYGVSAFEVGGGWGDAGSSPGYRPGPRDITGNGSEYFGTEGLADTEVFEVEDGEFSTSEYGDSWVEGFDPDGGSEGHFELPEKGGVPIGIFSLGTGLYVSNSTYSESTFTTGDAYHLAPGKAPAQVSGTELGSAMTGYLFATKSEQEADEKAQTEAKEAAKKEAEEKPEKEAKEKAEQEEREEAEEEAEFEEKLKAKEAEKLKAAEEEKLKAEKEAIAKTSGSGGISGALPLAPPLTGSAPSPSQPLGKAKVILLSPTTSAKLKSGAVKLSVSCGLPCTVAGTIVLPGAKAAKAGKSRELPFKSVKLPGSGTPVVVTLRFTATQRKLLSGLLRRHVRVTAKITVTEAPGGAAPQSRSIRIL